MPQSPLLIGHLIIAIQTVIFTERSKAFRFSHDSNIRDARYTPVALTVTSVICTSL